MKLVTYDDGRVGELVDGQVFELDVPDMRRYFELGGQVRRTGRSSPLDGVRLRAPIVPKKFFHTAGNFHEHHEESTRVNWSHPVLPWIVFFQNVDAIIGPDDPPAGPRGRPSGGRPRDRRTRRPRLSGDRGVRAGVRICIVGCGAIGGLYAAHLAQLPDVEVWAYDTSREHVDAINRHGLRITGHTELLGRVEARTDPAGIPHCRLGIVAVKGMFTEPAIAATAGVFADASVCSVQNGIGNEEVIAGYVERVMRGVTLPAARVAAPGVIHMDGAGTTWVGPFEPRPAGLDEVERLGSLLNRSGMETRAVADARGAQWTKLLFNCATNPLCALTGLSHGELCELPATRRLAGEVLREGRAVADALGIALEDDPEVLVDELGRANYDHKPSMLQDVLARRPTEIGTLNEGLVAQARAPGIPVPVNQAVVDLIRGLEESWTR